MTHPKHVDSGKPIPVRSRHDPVGVVSADFVAGLLQRIGGTRVKEHLLERASQELGYAHVTDMGRAGARARRWAANRIGRMPSHIALKQSEMLLVDAATLQRYV